MIRHEVIDERKLFLLKDRDFENEDFSGKDLVGFYVENSQFLNCEFENLKIKCMCFGAGEQQSIYTGCSFNRSTITGPTGGNARFVNCSFLDVSLSNFFFHKCEFINCIFSGDLKKIEFIGQLFEDDACLINRRSNHFSCNDFSQSKFKGVQFSNGIDLLNQKLPISENHLLIENAPELLAEFKKEVLSSNNEILKENATNIIKSLEFTIIKSGQKQLFLEVSNDPGKKEVYDLIRSIASR